MSPESSPPTVQNASRRKALLHRLQQEFGPQIVSSTGSTDRTVSGTVKRTAKRRAPDRRPTGLGEIDALIGGGFPVGCLSEISGATSSGRTSLVFALLAQATRSGAHVAWVDRAEAFDPPSAEAAGVVLERLLWVRAARNRTALRCTERILETEGFALVVLDLARMGMNMDRRDNTERIPQAAWLRLARLAAEKQITLVLLSDERIAGSRAALALEMQPAIAHFTGAPALLETLETRARLIRSKANFRAA